MSYQKAEEAYDKAYTFAYNETQDLDVAVTFGDWYASKFSPPAVEDAFDLWLEEVPE